MVRAREHLQDSGSRDSKEPNNDRIRHCQREVQVEAGEGGGVCFSRGRVSQQSGGHVVIGCQNEVETGNGAECHLA